MENDDFDEWGSVKLGFICNPNVCMCETVVGGLAIGFLLLVGTKWNDK